MTWWWLWDGFVFLSLVLSTISATRQTAQTRGPAALGHAVGLLLAVCLCWLAFLRVLSSYGAW